MSAEAGAWTEVVLQGIFCDFAAFDAAFDAARCCICDLEVRSIDSAHVKLYNLLINIEL